MDVIVYEVESACCVGCRCRGSALCSYVGVIHEYRDSHENVGSQISVSRG